MEKKVGLKQHLLEIASQETIHDIQCGMLLTIAHMEAYQTDEYVTLSEICTQMYQIQQNENNK
jgi:hypothetical protein